MTQSTKKRKNRKKTDPSLAFEKAWVWFSLFIRLRDKNCITCGKYVPYKEANAGHYVHKSKTSRLYFDPFNVHKQCVRCNKHLSGNLRLYSAEIIRRYGIDKFNELTKQSYRPKKWTFKELDEIIQKYKKEVEVLKNS